MMPITRELAEDGTGSVTANGVHSESPFTARSCPLSSISIPADLSTRIQSDAPPALRVWISPRNVTRFPRSISAGTVADTTPKRASAAVPPAGAGDLVSVSVAPSASVARPVAVAVYVVAASGNAHAEWSGEDGA